jgi:ribose transport system substrate-binding protein
MRSLRPLALMTLGGLAFGTAACGGADTGSTTTIGYSSPVASQVSAQQVAAGIKAAAGSLGWKAKVLDANLSASQQVSDVKTMIQQKVAAIASTTLDEGAAGGVYSQAEEAGIPIVGINSQGTGVKVSVWWEFNTCDGPDAPFAQTAAMMAKQHPGGSVVVMGGPPVPSLTANAKCFTDAAKANGLTVVTEVDNTSDDSAGAARLAADVLTKYPQVNAFRAYNDASALGISTAVTQAGLKVSSNGSAGVVVTGANGDADAVQAVRQGRLTGTWDPDSVGTGWAVVKAYQEVSQGEHPQRLVVKSTFVDAGNVGSYVPPEQRSYHLDSLPITQQ